MKCIDLTTLAGDDTSVNVARLCCRARSPFRNQLLKQLQQIGILNEKNSFVTAAVCVYPSRVLDCVKTFQKLNCNQINIAAVATGFPSGQFSLETRLKEIEFAIGSGANEIDVVINRTLALEGNWRALYEEISKMSAICNTHGAHLKVILAVGELGSLENIYKASVVAMLAGADFIKTSTGKETTNATLVVGTVMCRAVWDFFKKTGFKVGFKPAGGIKSAEDALLWLAMIRVQLGNEWTNAGLFRFGASSLLNEIEKAVFAMVFKRNPFVHEISL